MAFVPTSAFTSEWTKSSISPAISTLCRKSHSRAHTRVVMNSIEEPDMAFSEVIDGLAEYATLSDAEKAERKSSIPMDIVDGMDFFRYREGEWSSWRVTHHLAFRRSESGESCISMKCLEPDDERIVQLCKDWKVDPSTSQGGCFVTWKATLAWDQEGENHEGETVFALVPDSDDKRRGRILRDRGYAEIVPITGTYFLDDRNDLNLDTPYDGGAVIEKFSFDGPNIVNRVSTVKRFGGFSTATFANEQRVGSDVIDEIDEEEEEELIELMKDLPCLLAPEVGDDSSKNQSGNSIYKRNARWAMDAPGTQQPVSSAFSAGFSDNQSKKPSPTSAFGSGFSSGPSQSQPPPQFPVDGATEPSGVFEQEMEEARAKAFGNMSSEQLSDTINELASKAGIDLSRIPPSMRSDFLQSFEKEEKKGE